MKDKIELRPGAFLVPAFLLLVLPWQWVGAAVFAAGIHELCHIIALVLTGGEIRGIVISGSGATIRAECPCAWRECLSAMAGPLGSACMLLFYRQLPRVALCALVHCLYNLLPLFPLDGGRILRSILSITLSPLKAEIAERRIGFVTYLLVAVFLLAVTHCLGAAPLLLGILLLLRLKRKNSLPFHCFGDTI